MEKLFFQNDYGEGAHEAILKRLYETNGEHQTGYGLDVYCESAKRKIRDACAAPKADVFFISGGTQTNQLVIDALLPKYLGAVCAQTGHINGHEAGAIEATGHKVLTLPGHNGKIDPAELEAMLNTVFSDANRDHTVLPGMVYISYPTEYGTLYTRDELTAVRRICDRYGLFFFADGARLGYGLQSPACDMTLADFAGIFDVFYIGGTKVGALCGEAVVFPKGNAPKGFFTLIKQHGALLAKGRLMGVQFDTLFTDDLYMRISKHAIDMALKLRRVLENCGCRIFIDSPTNQQFVILENSVMEKLSRSVIFGFWEKYDDDHTVVRFATSWATKPEDIDALERILLSISNT